MTRIERDAKGRLDELVMPCAQVHLERMGSGTWFIEMTRADGTSLTLWLRSSRRIEVSHEEER